MAIRSGKMRHRIKFQSRDVTQDPTGDPTEKWVDQLTCWAEIQPLNGKELMLAQQLYSRVTTRFRLRWPGRLPDAAWRIVPLTGAHAGQWFHVKFVQVVNSIPHEVVVMAEELVEMSP